MGCSSCGNEPTCSIKCRQFLQVVHLSALQKDCALVSLVILKFIKSLLLTWASLTLCVHYILTDFSSWCG